MSEGILGKEKAEIEEKLKEIKEPTEFGLNAIGYPEVGRTTLSNDNIILFRIIVFSIYKTLSSVVGQSAANGVFYRAGETAGIELAKEIEAETFEDFLIKLAEIHRKLRIGILTLIERDEKSLKIRLDEGALCAGARNVGRCLGHCEAGIISGAMKKFLNKNVITKETKCWGKGDNHCEFNVIIES